MASPKADATTTRCLGSLRARVEDGRVRLTCYKTTPFFETTSGEPPDSVTIRVFRLAAPAFRFGRDYDEFFGGLDWREAAVIFEGVIPARNNRKYEFVDDGVAAGSTVAYWVGTDREEAATGPAPVRVRDARLWWPWAEIERRLEQLAAEHPQYAELVPVGHTVHGRPLRALLAGRRDRALMLIGAVHPGESGPELTLPAVGRLLRERPDLLARVGVAVLPSLCADERERLALGHPSYLRVNSNGVDLNRNFPADWETVDYTYGLITDDPDSMTYRGPAPASEPETRAVLALCEHATPAAVLSYHHLGSLAGSAFLVSQAAADDAAYLAACGAINRAYRAGMAPADVAERPEIVHPGCTAGSLPTWFYRQHGIPAFDLESDRSPECVRSTTDEATVEDLSVQQEQHHRGLTAVLELLAQSE